MANRLMLMLTLTLLATSYARAQGIEGLVMPGKLIEGHLEFENTCNSCHKRFNKKAQAQLCMDCHEDIDSDVKSQSGYHGKDPKVSDAQCNICHTDHEGRDADIVLLAEDNFDHRFTDFELRGAHVDTDCEGCHLDDKKHREALSTCVDCHLDEDKHAGNLGEKCGDCHNETTWEDAEFDHDTTDYSLIGKHQEAKCLDCHADHEFVNTPVDCYGCHKKDDEHEGRNGEECDRCHQPTDWLDTTFDHARDTEFPLEGSHAELVCADCHSEKPYEDNTSKTCVSCHEDDDEHKGHNGTECESCHISTEWEELTFDHDEDTEFDLLGKHQDVVCNDCHVEPIFDHALEANCYACHRDDDPHEGQQGEACNDCHNESGWTEDVLFDHDFTSFPLLGKHNEAECSDCHEDSVFGNAPTECLDCHEDEHHEGRLGSTCKSCHNPTGWEFFQFDHDTQTDFTLTGAHKSVGCHDCHRTRFIEVVRTSSVCIDCHRHDDVHDGEFGAQCSRCHTTDTFQEILDVQ